MHDNKYGLKDGRVTNDYKSSGGGKRPPTSKVSGSRSTSVTDEAHPGGAASDRSTYLPKGPGHPMNKPERSGPSSERGSY